MDVNYVFIAMLLSVIGFVTYCAYFGELPEEMGDKQNETK